MINAPIQDDSPEIPEGSQPETRDQKVAGPICRVAKYIRGKLKGAFNWFFTKEGDGWWAEEEARRKRELGEHTNQKEDSSGWWKDSKAERIQDLEQRAASGENLGWWKTEELRRAGKNPKTKKKQSEGWWKDEAA